MSAFVRVLLACAVSAALLCPAEATTRGARRDTIDTVVVHAISGPSCSGGEVEFSGAPGDAERWKRFFDTHPFLGIHYVVDREGVVLASTPEDRIANHTLDSNETSIGIELVHDGDGQEPFGPRQIGALIALLKAIRSRHNVLIENVVGHSDVDERRFSCGGRVYKTKMDPGANFPWEAVRAALRGAPQPVSGPTPAVRPRIAPAMAAPSARKRALNR